MSIVVRSELVRSSAWSDDGCTPTLLPYGHANDTEHTRLVAPLGRPPIRVPIPRGRPIRAAVSCRGSPGGGRPPSTSDGGAAMTQTTHDRHRPPPPSDASPASSPPDGCTWATSSALSGRCWTARDHRLDRDDRRSPRADRRSTTRAAARAHRGDARDHARLRRRSGRDPVLRQSDVPEHAELHYLLECATGTARPPA